MAVGLRNRWSDKDFRMVGETESVIDRYEDKLGTYLMKITSKSLSQSPERGGQQIPAHHLRF